MENTRQFTIKESVMVEQVIEKSKFIGYLAPVQSEDDAKEYLKTIKKMHPKATHHCSAYIVQDIERSNDDGEPSSSAGLPMLQVLRGHKMYDVIAVVVRYYGGVLLGVGGLIRAYGSSVTQALESAVLYRPRTVYTYRVSFPYEYTNEIETHFSIEGIIKDRIYDSLTHYVVSVWNPSHLNAIQDITRGQGLVEDLGTDIELMKEEIHDN